MIEQIIINNYKSIRHATIDLAPINVLIGVNGAGKSNFISFFELLKALYEQRLQTYIKQRGGIERLLYGGLKGSKQLDGLINFQNRNAFCFKLTPEDGGKAVLETSDDFNNQHEQLIRGEGTEHQYLKWHTRIWDNGVSESSLLDRREWRADYLRDFLRSFTVYHFHDTSRTSAMRQECDLHNNQLLRHDASNLPAYLYMLQQIHPKSFSLIERTIQSIAPYFKRFSLAPQTLFPDKILLEWEEQDSDMYLDAYGLSDGTLRFIALATLLLQSNPPSVIVIDEPELGLHPAAIEKLAGLVRVASHKAQVILATQSPALVSCFEPEDILVAERRDGGSVFTRPDRARLEPWLEDYSLGELWNKNIIGGRP